MNEAKAKEAAFEQLHDETLQEITEVYGDDGLQTVKRGIAAGDIDPLDVGVSQEMIDGFEENALNAIRPSGIADLDAMAGMMDEAGQSEMRTAIMERDNNGMARLAAGVAEDARNFLLSGDAPSAFLNAGYHLDANAGTISDNDDNVYNALDVLLSGHLEFV